MFALVESGSITKFFSGNRGITIGDNQYPKEISISQDENISRQQLHLARPLSQYFSIHALT